MRGDFGHLIYLKHLFRLGSVTNLKFTFTKELLSSTRAQQVLSYHPGHDLQMLVAKYDDLYHETESEMGLSRLLLSYERYC